MPKLIYPYSWNLDNDQENVTVIRIFGLDENNKSITCSISDFYPYIYLELPELEGKEWDNNYICKVISKIDNVCGKFKPLNIEVLLREKLYYANVQKRKSSYKYKKYPFLKCSMSHTYDIRKLKYSMCHKDGVNISGLGKLKFNVHEDMASPVLQFICTQDLPTCGWIRFSGKKIDKGEKETLCKGEYSVSYKNFMKVEEDFPVPKPIVLSFDIEVNSTKISTMPKATRPGDKIFQISCILSRQGVSDESKYKKTLLTLGNPLQSITGEDVEIRTFTTEADLLLGFKDYVLEKSPNLIIGYNILGFDIPYMIERADNLFILPEFSMLGFKKNKQCDQKVIKWSSSAYKNQEFKFIDADGRVFVDLLPLIKRDYKFDNFKLKTVSTFFLGESKDPLTPKGIFKCYRLGMGGTEKGNKAMGIVGKYCIQDSVLVTKLFEFTQTWVGLSEMAKTCNVSIFSLYTQGQQIKVFSQIYKYCFENEIVVQNDGYIPKADEHYTGATVFPPVPGAYDIVVPFDFNSLYPTTMIAYNIDYSTLVLEEDIGSGRISLDDCNTIEWEDHVGCEHDTSVRATKPKNIICACRKYHFLKHNDKGRMGVMPTLLTNLLGARKVTKGQMKDLKKEVDKLKGEDAEGNVDKIDILERQVVVLDKRQLSYKVSANSMYGAMGVKKGYLPFLPGAMCTTARGRQSIDKAAKVIQLKYRGKLIYGDTDSCYINFPHITTAQECWDYCLEVENKILDIFPKPMKLAFEEVIYWRFFILTKKRYMALSCGRDGILEDDIMKKGVLLARRDNSKWMRLVYENVIMQIFNRENAGNVVSYVLEEINKLFCRQNLEIKNFIITKSVGDVDDYKIREKPTDPKKLEKRLKDMGLNQIVDKNKLDKMYKLRSLPAHIQLAEKMRSRGQIVDAGSRMEYIVGNMGNNFKSIKANMFEKIEDPVYQQNFKDVIQLDYLYYLKLCSNPLNQALTVAYPELGEKFMDKIYKYRCKYTEVVNQIKTLHSSNLKFVE